MPMYVYTRLSYLLIIAITVSLFGPVPNAFIACTLTLTAASTGGSL